MKLLPLLLICAVLLTPAFAAEKTDLTLNDGSVLKAARIVTIAEDNITIVHEGGSITVPSVQVPLDALARAHMELSQKADDRKKQREELTKRAAERMAESDAKKADELQIRLAMANTRAAAQGGEQVAVQARAAVAIDAAAQIARLKANFPAQGKSKYTLHIKGAKTRTDTLELELPSTDQWTHYRGFLQSASVGSLPVILEKLETQFANDTAPWRKKQQADPKALTTEGQKARAMLQWFDGQLRPHLNTWRETLRR